MRNKNDGKILGEKVSPPYCYKCCFIVRDGSSNEWWEEERSIQRPGVREQSYVGVAMDVVLDSDFWRKNNNRTQPSSALLVFLSLVPVCTSVCRRAL